MELFYDGLREDVKDEIAKEDRPDTFDEFVSKVIKIDNRLYARRLERGGKDTDFRGPPGGRTQPNTSQRRDLPLLSHPSRLLGVHRNSGPWNTGKFTKIAYCRWTLEMDKK
ncbi:hypothetical protein E4U37_005250 [Claviceps purpurea]|nr:hypothetical protein E4U37_005250 [Claviceps purpurea]